MNISLHSKGIDLLPEEKEYAHQMAQKLLKRASSFAQEQSLTVKIEIDKEPIRIREKQFLCTITIDIPKNILRAEAHSAGVYTALDDGYHIMDKTLQKEKEKKSDMAHTPLPLEDEA